MGMPKGRGLFLCKPCGGTGIRTKTDHLDGSQHEAPCTACMGNGRVWGRDTDVVIIRAVHAALSARKRDVYVLDLTDNIRAGV